MEGEIAYRISKGSNFRFLPLEVLRRKYEPDFRWLWRRIYLEIKGEQEEREKIEEKMN